MGLADLQMAWTLIAVTLPAGVVGAVLAHHVPAQLLRIGYGVALVGIAWLLSSGESGRRADQPYLCPCLVVHSDRSHSDCSERQRRTLRAATGKVYRYCIRGLGLQRTMSGVGAFVAGLISTGVGEATLPSLVRRSRMPVPVARRPRRLWWLWERRPPTLCNLQRGEASRPFPGTSSCGLCQVLSLAPGSARTSRAASASVPRGSSSPVCSWASA